MYYLLKYFEIPWYHFIGWSVFRPHRSTTYAACWYRRSSVVCLSVCLSVGLRSWALQKRLSRSRCRLGCWLGWTRGNVLDGVQIPHMKGQLWGGKATDPAHVQQLIYSKRLCRGQHRYGANADWCVLDGVQIGGTWRIWWNPPCERGCGLMSDYFDHLCLYHDRLQFFLNYRDDLLRV